MNIMKFEVEGHSIASLFHPTMEHCDMMICLLNEFHSTFGEYDDQDITFPLWLKKTQGKWPWDPT